MENNGVESDSDSIESLSVVQLRQKLRFVHCVLFFLVSI